METDLELGYMKQILKVLKYNMKHLYLHNTGSLNTDPLNMLQ